VFASILMPFLLGAPVNPTQLVQRPSEGESLSGSREEAQGQSLEGSVKKHRLKQVKASMRSRKQR